jgi:hypothetical protein
VTSTSSPWKLYKNPAFPLNNATDLVVAQFADCLFATLDEKEHFTREESYNITQLQLMNVYQMWPFYASLSQ